MDNKHNIANVNPFESVDEFRLYADRIESLERQVKMLMECVTILMRFHSGKAGATNGLPNITQSGLGETGNDAP
jgi:hypothetical protein